MMEEELKKRILVLDGDMKTLLFRHGLTEEEHCRLLSRCHDGNLGGMIEHLNVLRPDVVSSVHADYIEAGADIIRSNTADANRLSLKTEPSRAYSLACRGVALAKTEAAKADKKIWVAGAVRAICGNHPSSKTLPALKEQMKGIVKGEPDFVLIEGCATVRSAVDALGALRKVSPEYPVAVLARLGEDGKLEDGHTLKEMLEVILPFGIFAFGIADSAVCEEIYSIMEALSSDCTLPLVCVPNSSLPYFGKAALMAVTSRKLADNGSVNIVGGGTGSYPSNICAESSAVCDVAPRPFTPFVNRF